MNRALAHPSRVVRPLALAALLALSAPALAQQTNPFLPAGSDSPSSDSGRVVSQERTQLRTAPRSVRAAPAPAPAVLPPSVGGLVLPPVPSTLSGIGVATAPMLPPPLPVPLPPVPASGPSVAVETPRPSTIFLSREHIEAARKRCEVALAGSSKVVAPAGGGRVEVGLKVSGGTSCIKAVQASEPWVQADVQGARLVLTVEPTQGAARSASVMVANTGASLTVVLEQRAH